MAFSIKFHRYKIRANFARTETYINNVNNINIKTFKLEHIPVQECFGNRNLKYKITENMKWTENCLHIPRIVVYFETRDKQLYKMVSTSCKIAIDCISPSMEMLSNNKNEVSQSRVFFEANKLFY